MDLRAILMILASVSVPWGGNIATVRGTNGGTSVAGFGSALTTFENNIPFTGAEVFFQTLQGNLCPGGTIGADGCVQGPTVAGTLYGGIGLNDGILNDGAFARSDLNAIKYAQVPEPSTLMLLGIGFLGIAATVRRRQK
jgi:hypothetical protein